MNNEEKPSKAVRTRRMRGLTLRRRGFYTRGVI